MIDISFMDMGGQREQIIVKLGHILEFKPGLKFSYPICAFDQHINLDFNLNQSLSFQNVESRPLLPVAG